MDLHDEHTLGEDRFLYRIPGVGPIIDEIQTMLVERGFLTEPVPLAELHRHIAPEAQRLDDHAMNAVNRSFYVLGDGLPAGYEGVIRSLAGMVEWDFLFQAAPIIRFHFPVPYPGRMRGPSGRGAYFHSDLMGGHPVEMVNAWLALTPTGGTSALHVASLADSLAILDQFSAGMDHDRFGRSLDEFVTANREDGDVEARVLTACRPLPMDAGDLVLFDPRCIHGGAENVADATRVSMDFRVIPLGGDSADFETDLAARHPRWQRGEILAQWSARELVSASG